MESGKSAAITLELSPLLQTDDLEVEFDGFKALRGIRFTLNCREMHALIGPGGSGKTTLLDVFSGKVKPSKGRVMLNGSIDLSRFTVSRIARQGTGRKLHSPSVFTQLSVLDNMLLSMKQSTGLFDVIAAKAGSHHRDKLVACAKLVGIEEKLKWKAGALSHGERVWLEIGMLLVQEPEILLLDEPTAGMSESEKEKTGMLLRRICSEQSVIVVERDLDFVRRFAHSVTVLHEGTVLAAGRTEEVLTEPLAAKVCSGK